MVYGFTDIVKKSGTLCRLNINTDFRSQKTGKVRNFDRML